MRFRKFTVKDSAYEYAYDDHCIVLRAGKNQLYIDPVILPKLNSLAKRLKKREAVLMKRQEEKFKFNETQI